MTNNIEMLKNIENVYRAMTSAGPKDDNVRARVEERQFI